MHQSVYSLQHQPPKNIHKHIPKHNHQFHHWPVWCLLLLALFNSATALELADEANELKHLDYFSQAYKSYPAIPAGYLEAMAYINTRWQHVTPSAETAAHSHHERPQVVGIMGLHRGDHGYQNQVSQAAKLLGIKSSAVMQSPQTNIMATAALINDYISQQGLKNPRLEDMASVTTLMMGTPNDKEHNEVNQFIAASQFYDLLLVLDRGHDDHGIFIIDQAINWSEAFAPEMLSKMRAPAVRLSPTKGSVVIEGAVSGLMINPIDETFQTTESDLEAASPDYGGANWIASPYHGSRTAAIDSVTVHTTQGSYAGTLSWFQNNPYSVSAHYVIRSSDGQVTQMVREYRRAHHVGIHNSSTLGIEHEGYVSNPAWYTTAMYNASANLTRHFCQSHSINCATAYNGPAHSNVVVLSSGIKVKGHQHYTGQNHTDPGIHWDWARYHQLINGSGGGGSANDLMLDDFEQSEGRFNTTPTYSGSTTGISTASFAERTSTIKRNGSYSEQIQLKDNPNSSANWSVRFLSASGSSSNNPKLNKAGGRIGFWVLAAGSGMQVAVTVDDVDGTERSDKISLNANQWTYVEWKLDNSAEWNPWFNGNGILGSQVSLDAIWFFRNQTSFTVNVYIDDVQYRFEG
jgi:hypothetical protein